MVSCESTAQEVSFERLCYGNTVIKTHSLKVSLASITWYMSYNNLTVQVKRTQGVQTFLIIIIIIIIIITMMIIITIGTTTAKQLIFQESHPWGIKRTQLNSLTYPRA